MQGRAADEREHILDLLKGICIIVVIMTHWAWTGIERRQLLFPWWVDMAVPVFMMISGYVYKKSYERNGTIHISDAYSLKSLSGKTIRFTVPFLIAFIIEVIWDKLSPTDVVDYSITKTFLIGGLGPGSYYYPVMMQFIFIAPIIYFIIKMNHFRGLLICLLINVIYEVLHVAYGMPVACYRLLVFRYIFLIAVGCYLAFDYPEKKSFFIVLFVAGGIFKCMTCYWGYKPIIVIDWTGTCFLSSMYVIPIVALIIKKVNLHCKLLELFGQASYNIFLTQMVYYYCASKFVYRNISNRWVQLTISIIACLTAGTLFYFAEKPITKWIKDRVNAIIDYKLKQMI